MHRCGAIVLEGLLEHEDGSSVDRSCSCEGKFADKKKVGKTIITVLGPVLVIRTYQRCNGCGEWRVPEDIVLDVVNTSFSCGLRRIVAITGAEVCFDKARNLIAKLAGIEITDKQVERIAEAIGADIARREQEGVEDVMAGDEPQTSEAPATLYIAADGTGVSVLRKETEGRKGKAADGIARTREAKLGAVFTQTNIDQKGNPVRNPHSTTYVGRIESVDTFGPRLYAEALNRGLANAGRVVVIGDGAVWIWNMAEDHFKGATQILDYYHAAKHLSALAKALFPSDKQKRKEWLKPNKDLLWEGEIEQLLSELRSLNVNGKKKEKVEELIGYYENNKKRMDYAEFRKQGLFIGSGVVEAGCRSVIGQRLKQSGMHWSVRGANSIIALRCCTESGKLEDYWESRTIPISAAA
jgi:hypothetical protein